MIFIAKISKGHNSKKTVDGCGWSYSSFFSAHRLMMVYVSIKFHENILEGMKISGHAFHQKNFKGP